MLPSLDLCLVTCIIHSHYHDMSSGCSRRAEKLDAQNIAISH